MATTEVSVVIPVYNEEEAIGGVLDALRATLDGINQPYEIIVVDDGSEDGTTKIVQERNFVRLIRHPYTRGYGAALKTGIMHANGEFILMMDGDGSYPAGEIPKLIKHRGEYDMVVGARAGKDVKIPRLRRPARWFLSKLANYIAATKIPDLNSGMRLFRKRDIEKFFDILPPKFSFTTVATLSYHTAGHSVKYIPIGYHKRVGKSKIRPRDFLDFIMLILRTATYFNPLKVFMSVGVAFFIAAVFIALFSIVVIGRFMDVTFIVLVVAAVQTVLFGLLADLIVKSRRSK